MRVSVHPHVTVAQQLGAPPHQQQLPLLVSRRHLHAIGTAAAGALLASNGAPPPAFAAAAVDVTAAVPPPPSSSSSSGAAGATERAYDAYAGTYDELDGGAAAEGLGFPTLRRQLLQRASGSTLEVALGTGLNLPLYRAAAPAVTSLTGIDISAGMLGQARRRAAGLDLPPRLRPQLVQADVGRLPQALQGRTFDTGGCSRAGAGGGEIRGVAWVGSAWRGSVWMLMLRTAALTPRPAPPCPLLWLQSWTRFRCVFSTTPQPPWPAWLPASAPGAPCSCWNTAAASGGR